MWVAVIVLIGTSVPLGLLASGAVVWLTWRAVRDSRLPPPVMLRELPPQQVRAEIRVIRGELNQPEGR